MYGNYSYDKAVRLAKSKTKETGDPHIVVPSEDEPDKWTIGVPIKALTGADLMGLIKSKSRRKAK